MHCCTECIVAQNALLPQIHSFAQNVIAQNELLRRMRHLCSVFSQVILQKAFVQQAAIA
jgi:hypothetical protein